jgi:hypothetical protein
MSEGDFEIVKSIPDDALRRMVRVKGVDFDETFICTKVMLVMDESFVAMGMATWTTCHFKSRNKLGGSRSMLHQLG